MDDGIWEMENGKCYNKSSTKWIAQEFII